MKDDVNRIELIDRGEHVGGPSDERAHLQPSAADLTGDLGTYRRVVDILPRGIDCGLRCVELRSRVVDVLLRDGAFLDERYESSERALGVVEAGERASRRGLVI